MATFTSRAESRETASRVILRAVVLAADYKSLTIALLHITQEMKTRKRR